jgi:hypothetical protein
VSHKKVLLRLLALMLTVGWGPSALSQRIELTQTLDFKWQALTVATMQFDVSLLVTESEADSGASEGPPSRIRIIGETKGPLRWIQDYQATVEYSTSRNKRQGSVFALEGLDGGEPEQRRILFVPGKPPNIEIFNDSTASQPLELKEEWLGQAENPLSAFAAVLQAAIRGQSCVNSIWGFDGKRRYQLEAKDLPVDEWVESAPVAEPELSAEAEWKAVEQYQCSLTLYARGRDTAGSNEESERPRWRSRFASLWPFSDTDRELIFSFDVYRSNSGHVHKIAFNRIVIPTGIGAIVAQSR